MRRFLASPLSSLSLLAFFVAVLPAQAADFNPNFVIADQDLIAKDAMNQASIQSFLETKQSGLATMAFISDGKDRDGNQLPQQNVLASQAIYDIAQRWAISPKFLLVLIQKEQSLVTTPSPSQRQLDWATGYAVCDNCSTSDPAIQRWRGFYKQVNSAAAQFDYYLDHPSEFTYQTGGAYTIDGTIVTPANTATAAMYNYTPHLHGNRNFFTLWNQWFSKHYPDGSLVQVPGDDGVWYLQYGTRRPIKSKAALASRFNTKGILPISQGDLEAYPEGWPITLANYSLVRSPRGQTYLIVDDEKRPILSDAVFKKIGWNPAEVDDVTEEDLANFFEGTPITDQSIYPQGVLAQDTKSGGIYFIEDGSKYPIWSKELMAVNYPDRKLIKLTPTELDAYPTGEPVKFPDGTLVKKIEFPEVYVVSNGTLRWIPDEATFLGLGYRWGNIVSASEKVLSLYQLGEPLTAQ